MTSPFARITVPLIAAALLFGNLQARPACAYDEQVVIHEDVSLERLAWSADGKTVATRGGRIVGKAFQFSISLWDARTGERLRSFEDEQVNQTVFAFSRDFLAVATNGRFGKTGRDPREVQFLDTRTWEIKERIDRKSVPGMNSWSDLAFSGDGSRLATAGIGRAPDDSPAPFLKIWHRQRDRWIARDVEYFTPPLVEPLEGRIVVLYCVEFTPDGTFVAAGCNDSQIRLFSGLTGKLVTTLDLDPVDHNRTTDVQAVAFSPDGRSLLSPGIENTVLVWNVADRKPRMKLKGHDRTVTALAWSPDGRLLATGSRNSPRGATSQIFLWDAHTGQMQREISDLEVPVTVLAFSPDSTTLAICMGAANFPDGEKPTTTGGIRFVKVE